MELVPVIDLLGGHVVRAVRGERSRYQPMRSPLCASHHAVDVAKAYLELYPFQSLYLADLDAIQGQGDNRATIKTLRAALPHVTLFLDAGMRTPLQLRRATELGCKAVIGSEGLHSLDDYLALRETSDNDLLLSLDFGRDGFRGPIELLQQPQLWPAKVICMTLTKVGSMEGPDYAHLASLRASAGDRHVYAAGGVRDAGDVKQLQAAGIHGALVASALHQGSIGAAQLAELQA